MSLKSLRDGIPAVLPPHPGIDASVPHAPRRPVSLSDEDTALALKNALRYFPESQHAELLPELAKELSELGHIYCHRLRPTEYQMRAHALGDYPAACAQAASIMLMIMNNLDPAVAQFPHELVTYGGNGSVFSNWAQASPPALPRTRTPRSRARPSPADAHHPSAPSAPGSTAWP